MDVFGIDFTSSPGRGKPLAGCRCTLDQDALTLQEFLTWKDYSGLAELLRAPGPWAMGLDFPFSQSAQLVREAGEHLLGEVGKGPVLWESYAEKLTSLDRTHFKTLMQTCPTNAKGVRERRRLADTLARAQSPQHVDNPPVGLMFHAGARLLLESPAHIHPVRPNGDSRLVVEAYPGVFARRFAHLDGYKNTNGDQMAKAKKRAALCQRLASEELAGAYGLRAFFTPEHERSMTADRHADYLDAFICAVQAAWAFRTLAAGADPAAGTDPELMRFEGWIMDPHLAAPDPIHRTRATGR